MGMDEDNVKVFPANWGGMASKPCDSCKSAAAILFCRPDSAFLCMGCDSKIHGANKLASRHERVWMCEVCEQAPAAVTCKADAAALCVTCDSDIHSANPLARRHDRVPVEPFYDSAESLVKSSSSTISATANTAVNFLVPTIDENEAASWLLPNPNVNTKLADTTDVVKTGGGGDMFFSDFDHLLEFDYINSMNANLKQQHQHQEHTHGSNADSVVPVQQQIMNSNHNHNHNHHQPTETCFDIDFCKSKLTPYNYTTTQSSLSHSISSSELEVGIVPDGTSVVSDTSYTFGKQMNSSIGNGNGGGGGGGVVDQLSGMDREARVLRYREKRKNRKFEKTIRYASRKAYAETRPRIKGRFAKRTETETETETDIDQMFIPVRSAGFMADSGYGVVPSF